MVLGLVPLARLGEAVGAYGKSVGLLAIGARDSLGLGAERLWEYDTEMANFAANISSGVD